VAGDQYRPSQALEGRLRRCSTGAEQGIDAAVAGNVDFASDLRFGSKIGGGGSGGGEE
jgi:hypothetical protein